MKRYTVLVTTTLTALLLSGSAFAAVYMKYDDIKGEARETTREATPPRQIDAGDKEEAGLLLPAVQKMQTEDERGEAKTEPKAGKKKGNVEYNWKVEEGEK